MSTDILRVSGYTNQFKNLLSAKTRRESGPGALSPHTTGWFNLHYLNLDRVCTKQTKNIERTLKAIVKSDHPPHSFYPMVLKHFILLTCHNKFETNACPLTVMRASHFRGETPKKQMDSVQLGILSLKGGIPVWSVNTSPRPHRKTTLLTLISTQCASKLV